MNRYTIYLNLFKMASTAHDDALATFFMLELTISGLFDFFDNDTPF